MGEADVIVLSGHDLRIPNGGTQRTLAFAEAFRLLGARVVEVCPATAGDRPDDAPAGRIYTRATPLGLQNWTAPIRTVKRALLPLPSVTGAWNRGLEEMLPGWDQALVHAPFSLGYRLTSMHAPCWVDFHDVMSRYASREARLGPRARIVGSLAQAAVSRLQEQRCVRRAAIVSAAGWLDAAALAGRSAHDVSWIPNPVRARSVGPGPGTRTAGMIADFRYAPNVAAWEWMARHWLPVLRGAGWSVVLAGHGSDTLAGPARGVRGLGSVADVAEFYASIDVALAPITRGGGIKVKVIEALAFERPVVATSFAVEGLPRTPGGVRTVANPEHLPQALSMALEATVELPAEYTFESFIARVRGIAGGRWLAR